MTTKKTFIVSGVISLVVALVVGLGFAAPQKSPTSVSTVGGTIDGGTYNSPANFTQGLSLGGNEVSVSKAGIIGSSMNHATWLNNTGRVVWVEYAEMDIVSTTAPISFSAYATASSSMRFSVGTTTSNSTSTLNAFDYVRPFATLIDNALIATTSMATSSVNSDYITGTDQGSIAVLPGQYVYLSFRQDQAGAQCTGATCEQATSTNRGFNVHWFLSGHYSP